MSKPTPLSALKDELKAVREAGIPNMALYERALRELICARKERDDALAILGRLIYKNAKREADSMEPIPPPKTPQTQGKCETCGGLRVVFNRVSSNPEIKTLNSRRCPDCTARAPAAT